MRTLAALALALPLAACSMQPNGAAPPRLVSVTGSGEVVAAPDRATITLSIAARAKDLAAAQAEADKVVAKVMEVADGLDIDEKKVQTTGIQIQPEFEWVNGKRNPLGYLVQRTTTIQLDDLSKLGKLIEQTLATGVNEVSPPVLSSSKSKELARAALRLAGEDATRNAEALADSLGASLGEVYSATGQGGEPPSPPPMMMKAMRAEMAGDVAETYAAGEIRVTASVQAQFELE